MTGPGPIALMGGFEHRFLSQPVDRWLLEQTGATDPHVVVVPAGSSRRRMPSTAALARTYWTGLGARTSFALPDGGRSSLALEALETADVIVLTGGLPGRIVTSLGQSPVWGRVLERWQAGAAIAGSSAGSMALFEWRLRLLPTHPFQLVPGLGPLSWYVTLPHFDRYLAGHPLRRTWLAHMTRNFRGLGVLGLDEGTALAGREGDYRVLGRGSVTVLRGGRWRIYPSGADVPVVLGRRGSGRHGTSVDIAAIA